MKTHAPAWWLPIGKLPPLLLTLSAAVVAILLTSNGISSEWRPTSEQSVSAKVRVIPASRSGDSGARDDARRSADAAQTSKSRVLVLYSFYGLAGHPLGFFK